jgi:hypothetical protein
MCVSTTSSTNTGLDQQEAIHLRGEVEKVQIELADVQEQSQHLESTVAQKTGLIEQLVSAAHVTCHVSLVCRVSCVLDDWSLLI